MIRRGAVRAILASEFWMSASARGIAPGLREAGWMVEEVDEQRFMPKSTTLFQRIEGRLRAKFRLASFQSEILAAVAVHEATVMITVKGHYIKPVTLTRLRNQGVFLVNYYPDYRFINIAMERMSEYDLVVTTKSFHLEELRKIMPPENVAFLHHGFNAELHRPIPSATAPTVDVLYVGNATPTKTVRIFELAQALPDIKIKVVGSRWAEFARRTPLASVEVAPAVHGDFYAAEIANAKIVLGFHMGVEASTGFEDLVSTRSFEIPACGGFMLHVDNEEIRSLYDVPGEIDTFASPEELVDKVRFWLAHPEERAEVARRGYARAVPAYSYVKRGLELAALIEARMAAKTSGQISEGLQSPEPIPQGTPIAAVPENETLFRADPINNIASFAGHGNLAIERSSSATLVQTISARAVFASDFSHSSAARGIVPGLRDSGWLVEELDASTFSMPPLSLAARIENRLRVREQRAALQQAILRSTNEACADLFMTVKGYSITNETLAALRKRGLFCVNYYPDYHFNDVPISSMANYDLVITTKSFQLQALTELLGADRVGFVHHGYGNEIHRPLVQAQQPVDVLYIGNPTPPKVALLSALVSALPAVRFRVCGSRWRTLVRGTPLERVEIGNAPHGDYYAAEIGAAKITLSFHMGVDKATGFEDQVSMRSFEIPACGGFMMHIDNPEVRTLYEVGQEIDVFADVDELVSKIGYWLAHPDERKAVAARGYARAAPAYGYAQRGREIAALVAERRAAL